MFSGRVQKVRFLSGLGTFRKHEDDYLNNSYLGGRKHRVRLRPGGIMFGHFGSLDDVHGSHGY